MVQLRKNESVCLPSKPEGTPAFTVWLRFLFARADFTLELPPSEISFALIKRKESGKMGKTSQKMFNILSAIEFLVLGASLGLSIYILTLAPTLDNVFSIVVVAFTG